MTHRRILVLTVCAWAAASAACAELLDFKTLREADSGSAEAGPDAQSDATDTCSHASWPGSPDASAPGTAAAYDMALRHVYFATPEGDAGVADFGYDLDGRCTIDSASASCHATALVTDDSNGRDNASIQLMGTLSSIVTSIDDTAVNATIANGQYTVMLRILGLRSFVDQQTTTGLQLGVQASPGLESDAAAPKFDGTDRWLVATEDSISPSSNVPNPINGAYVSNGVLVSQAPSQMTLHVLIPSGAISGTLIVTLHEPLLTGRLVQTDAGLGMEDGIIAGRWRAADMLAAIADLTANSSGAQPVCDYAGGVAFETVRTKVCALRDVDSNGSDDNTTDCDGVSVAIRFDAVPAQVATDPVPFPPTATPCPHDAGACP